MSQANSEDFVGEGSLIEMPAEDNMFSQEEELAPVPEVSATPRVHSKQGFNIYSMLLLLSFLFLLVATIMFFNESGKY